jgi:hypothetical protein
MEDSSNGTAWKFPTDDSVRRLVVPADQDDLAFPQAQRPTRSCQKDQQDVKPVKNKAGWSCGMALSLREVRRFTESFCDATTTEDPGFAAQARHPSRLLPTWTNLMAELG